MTVPVRSSLYLALSPIRCIPLLWEVRFSFSYTGPRGLLREMVDGLLDDDDLREVFKVVMKQREEENDPE